MRDVAVFVIGIVHLAGHAYHRHHTRRCQRGRFGVVGIGVLLGGHRRCAARPPPQRVIGVGDVLRAAASHAIDHILHLPVVAVSIGIPHRHRPRRRSVLRGGHLAGGGRIGIAHRGRKLRRGQRTTRILPFLRQASRQVTWQLLFQSKIATSLTQFSLDNQILISKYTNTITGKTFFKNLPNLLISNLRRFPYESVSFFDRTVLDANSGGTPPFFQPLCHFP